MNQQLENELANAIMKVMVKHVKTGFNTEGFGKFIQCSIDFKYLNNAGGVVITDLNYKDQPSDYIEP